MKTILVVTSLQSPERTLNLDTVEVDMFLLHGTVRTEIVLDTGAPIVCQVPLYLSACNHFFLSLNSCVCNLHLCSFEASGLLHT